MGIHKWHTTSCHDNISHINNRCQSVIWLSFILGRDWSNNVGTYGPFANLLSQDIQRRSESVPRGIFQKCLQIFMSLSRAQMGKSISKK